MSRPAQPLVKRAITIGVAIGRALAGALVRSGADQLIDIRLLEQLRDRLRHPSQEVDTSGFGHQLGQR